MDRITFFNVGTSLMISDDRYIIFKVFEFGKRGIRFREISSSEDEFGFLLLNNEIISIP